VGRKPLERKSAAWWSRVPAQIAILASEISEDENDEQNDDEDRCSDADVHAPPFPLLRDQLPAAYSSANILGARMSTLDDRWADDDIAPDSLAVAALAAPRCRCEHPILDGDQCGYCGREIRAEGSLSRDFRTAAYMRRLSWAAGAGLPRSTGFSEGYMGRLGRTRSCRRWTPR
jgi:hypothetical protein